jgi:3',5'-cyclic AMP phosphodiesterase CpdA
LILHASDTHFGTERPEVAAALERLVREVRPEVAIFSGDITQRAKTSEFTAAKLFITRLGITNTLVIPGNHDIPLFDLPSRIFHPYKRYQQAFGETLEPIYSTPQLLVVCVNTTRNYRHEDGEISGRQIVRTQQLLQAATPQQLKIVVTHQPVYVTEKADIPNLLHHRGAAITAWAAAGADLILGGHIHLPFVVGLHEQLQAVKHPLWVVQAGTAISQRIRKNTDNSINLIRYQRQGRYCAVERWDYADNVKSFKLASTHTLHLANAAG